jgi:hypothetical protein
MSTNKRIFQSRPSGRESVLLSSDQSHFANDGQVSVYVRQLANLEGIVFAPTYADLWASAVTQLAGDEVKSDATDDLLVALTRAGKLSPRDMTKLVIAHHRNLVGV